MGKRPSPLHWSAFVRGQAPQIWVVRAAFLLGRVALNPARSFSLAQLCDASAQLRRRCGRRKAELWARTAFAGVANNAKVCGERTSNFLRFRGASHVLVFSHRVSRTGNFVAVHYFRKQSSFTHFYLVDNQKPSSDGDRRISVCLSSGPIL